MTEVFRGFDQAMLNAQYDLRTLWPDVPDIIAHRENESARVRARIPGRIDIAYGECPGQRLDVFPPSNGRNGSAALIYIHGGYWQSSDKNDTTYIAPAFIDAGITFITLNYTLAPAATLSEMVDDCRQAITWIWHHAEEVGVDRQRLYLAGHSAGAHLTAMMLTTEWKDINDASQTRPIRGACALSGLYDMEPIRLCFVNEVLGLKLEDVADNSPLFLEPLMDIPMILSVGDMETDEFKRHQTELHAVWGAKGLAIDEVPAPHCHHYTIVGHFGDPETVLHRAMIDMIRGG